MAKAVVSLVTFIMVAIIMVSIITAIPDSLETGGSRMQPVYSAGAATSPTDYANSILTKR